ncbi:MAG TPA: 1-phosphofructokinase family hexose kinase [Solirubrobacterales bacterium]|nr:1-phosphofructokinase family hexose kinase [Solirubrobacterales bacterium]
MILTVTLNAAIDRTVAVPNFRLGQRHRALEARTMAGGKGVNVARALRLLERPVIATGLAGGATGTRLLEELREEQVLTAFIRIGGESRTNLAVVDPTTGEQTEINERGPEIGAADVERLVEKLVYLGRGATACVLAGSVPPGAPEDIYARLVSELRALDVLTVLDTDGEPMRAALRAGPAVVAPNLAEAEDAVGHEFNDPGDLALGLSSLVEMGAEEAIITSETGCVAIVGEGAERRRYEARIDQLDPVTTVGSGDAFLAGYVAARHQGGRPHECLAFGVACGAESTQHFGAGTLDRREVERLVARVDLRELDVAAEVA